MSADLASLDLVERELSEWCNRSHYFEVEVADGVWFIADTCSPPYLGMDVDSEHYEGRPSKHQYLMDYSGWGDELSAELEGVVRRVTGYNDEACFMFDEHNSNEKFLVWHGEVVLYV